MEQENTASPQVLDTLADSLLKLATGRRILVVMTVFAVYIAAVMVPAYGRIETFSGGVGAIDFLIAYSPEQAYTMIAAYGPAGRQYYATIALTLDIIFPVASALVFSLVLAHVFHRAFSREGVVQRALLIPPAAMVADFLENISIATMLLSYPQELPAAALLASAFSTVKWTAVSAQGTLLIIGLAAWLIRKGLQGDERI